MSESEVSSFAVSGTPLFAGTFDGWVFLSTNNGRSWKAVNTRVTNSKIYSLAVSDTNLFVGTSAGWVFVSTNSGTSWTGPSTGLTNTGVLSLAVNGTKLFAGTGEGVFVSTDYGTSWTAASSGLSNDPVHAFAVSGMNLFAGTGNGVFHSTNSGVSWTREKAGLTDTYVNAVVVFGTKLYAGTLDGVFLSTNDGASWTSTGLTYRSAYKAARSERSHTRREGRLALEVGYAVNEVRIGSPGPEATLGALRAIGFAIGFTTLVRDPYNGHRPATSVSGLGSLGLLLLVSRFLSKDVDQNSTAYWLGMIFLGPLFIANSELHYVMISPDSVSAPGVMTLSIYAATRTDIFAPWKNGGSSWTRFSPALGFSLQRQVSPMGHSVSAKSIALQCGVEYPVDIIENAGKNGLRAFVGLRYLFSTE